MKNPESGSRRAFLGRALIGVAGAGLMSVGAADGADSSDEPLLAAIDDQADLELLRRMVRIRSYSREETPLATFLVEQLKALGLQAQLQEVQAGRFQAIGILKGTGAGKSLMFNGHIDTNPVGVGWTVDPFGGVVKDGFIYGIGVSNMKASCAAFVGAARALIASKTRLRGDVIITHVVGELTGGDGTRKAIDSGLKADYFINGEPTDLALMTVHAVGLSVTINTIGVTRHMSKLEESVSSIDTMYQVIQRVRNLKFTDSPRSNAEYASIRRINVGTMRAGLGRDVQTWRGGAQVPDFADIQVSIRFGPDLTPESVLADLNRELAELHAEDPRVVTEVVPRARPAGQPFLTYEIPKDRLVVRTVAQRYEQVLGKKPAIGAVAPYRYYGTDSPQLQHAGMAGVVCGVGGKYNTMPDERVELTDYHAASRIYALTAKTLCS